MPYLAFALIVVSGMAAAVGFAIYGHPWLSFCTLLIIGTSSMKTSDKDSEDKEGKSDGQTTT